MSFKIRDPFSFKQNNLGETKPTPISKPELESKINSKSSFEPITRSRTTDEIKKSHYSNIKSTTKLEHFTTQTQIQTQTQTQPQPQPQPQHLSMKKRAGGGFRNNNPDAF